MNEKKQLRALIAVASVFVVLLAAYFAVISPMMKETENPVTIELLEGEAQGPNNRVLMFEQIGREKIKSIVVRNEHGKYSFLQDDNTFVIEDYEDLPYNGQMLSSLIVSAGYTVTSTRVTSEATDEDLEKYGLDDSGIYWTLKTTDDARYKVIVGDKLVSDSGYYAMLEGRENCVYVISTSIESSILQPIEAFITPTLCVGLTESNYYMLDNFTVMHGDKMFVLVKQSKKEEFVNPDAVAETKLLYPSGYKTDDTFFMSNVAYNFVSMMGEETVYVGDDDDELAKYGLDKPYYSIYFTFTSGKSEVEYYFFVSEKQDDGYYYAVSNLYDFEVVAKCSADKFKWLESRLVDWVDDYPIALNIVRVDSIEIGTGDEMYSFDLSHGVSADEKATLEVDGPDGFHLSNEEVYNFRELYKDFLAVQIMGQLDFSADEKDAIIADEEKLMTTIRFNMTDGSVNEYSFYRYSTGRALLSANGSEDFFVYDDWLIKIESDLQKLLAGLEINSHSKN